MKFLIVTSLCLSALSVVQGTPVQPSTESTDMIDPMISIPDPIYDGHVEELAKCHADQGRGCRVGRQWVPNELGWRVTSLESDINDLMGDLAPETSPPKWTTLHGMGRSFRRVREPDTDSDPFPRLPNGQVVRRPKQQQEMELIATRPAKVRAAIRGPIFMRNQLRDATRSAWMKPAVGVTVPGYRGF